MIQSINNYRSTVVTILFVIAMLATCKARAQPEKKLLSENMLMRQCLQQTKLP